MAYPKGGSGHWRGKKRGKTPDKVKLKISLALKGFKRTKQNRMNISSAKLGSKNPSWKGGRTRTPSGHILIHHPKHPHANVNGRVFEHRLNVEKKLGRYLLREEIVHHIDCDSSNNSEDNLFLTTRSGNSKAHGSFNKLVSKLLKDGIIKFNIEKGIYERI